MKNLLLQTIILMLCLFALLLGTACTEPEPPADPLTEPTVIESSEFLPAPDEIVIWWCNGSRKIAVSEETKKELYRLFDSAMQHMNEDSFFYDPEQNIATSLFSHTVIEFVYGERHKYVAQTDGGQKGVLKNSFEYDGILFSISKYAYADVGGATACRLDGKVVGIEEQQRLLDLNLSYESLEFRDECYEIVSQCIIENMIGGHPDVDSNPVESEKFLEQPDSMRLIHKEQVEYLTEEQQNALFEAFERMMEHLDFIAMERTLFSSGQVIGWFRTEDTVCLEFCYEKRQKYVGEPIQPAEDEFCFVISGFEFDGILFVIDDGFPRIAMRKDGRYYGLCGSQLNLQLWTSDLDFYHMIKELDAGK